MWDPGDAQRLTLGEGVADLNRAFVVKPDDVTGIGGLDDRSVFAMNVIGLCADPCRCAPDAASYRGGNSPAHPHERDAVSMR